MITNVPDNYSYVGNPLMVKVSGAGRQTVTISKESDGNDYALYVETFKLSGSVDISQYVRTYLNGEYSTSDNAELGETEIEFEEISILHASVFIGTTQRVFLRGMRFLLEKTRDLSYRPLTIMQKIIVYKGINRYVSFLPIPGMYVDIFGQSLSINGSQDMGNSGCNHLSIDFAKLKAVEPLFITFSDMPLGDNIVTESGKLTIDSVKNEIVSEANTQTMGVVKRFPVEVKDVPEHPFYVRWTNRYGGYDYWMFSCVHQKEWELSEQEVALSYYEDVDAVYSADVVKTFGQKYSHKVTAMAGALEDDQFEAIRDMVFADIIEVRMGIDDTRFNTWWQRITLEKTSISKMSESPRTDVELTFNIPII